ncbi:MAG: PH domain-containing protein [Candidatus Pacebacteria bacterium]|nr:PH domain-containing protein [Candidatus Paceibacterota bacterium]
MEEFELEPGETITLLVRKHWIVLVGQLISYFILAILPLFIPIAINALGSVSSSVVQNITAEMTRSGAWLRLALAFWWLFIWIAAFSSFMRYWLTLWIITSTRIVEIHQYGFFSRKVSSFLLNRVQDVTTEVSGLFATIFGYGALDVETAGRDEKFGMYDIQNPEGLRDLIMREVAALHADGQPTAPAAQTGV